MKNKNQIMELLNLLIQANNCLKHARIYIKNLKLDFKDDGQYKICCDKIDNFLEKIK